MRFNTEPDIKVGILKHSNIRLNLLSEYINNDNGDVYSGITDLLIDHEGNILISNKGKSRSMSDAVFLRPLTDDAKFEVNNVAIGVGFHWETRERQCFEGAIEFILDEEEIQLINIVSIEKYLTSVIASEMKAEANVEFLKAHALISRSWVIAQILGRKKRDVSQKIVSDIEISTWYDHLSHKHFDVCADDHCQRYQGIKRVSENAINAIIETKGEVLMFNDDICDARFSKSCGGVTECFENVWEPNALPYLTNITDSDYSQSLDLSSEQDARNWILSDRPSFCNPKDQELLGKILNNFDLTHGSLYRWEVEYTQHELRAIIAKKSGFDFGDIVSIEPVKRGTSGRIIRLRILGTRKRMVVGKELEIRKWLSETHLFSSAFVVYTSDIRSGIPRKFTFKGAGWGHGVGLCQIGAASMGERGYSYRQILAHYYKNAKVNKIY